MLFTFLLTTFLASDSYAQFTPTGAGSFGSSFGNPGIDASYDYVVVGGGTAGLTLATRLAQNGSFSVAVVEAGSFSGLDNGNRSKVPYECFNSANINPDMTGVNSLIDWKFLTLPQKALTDRRQHYTRGKCLGGSSARNYMVYQRGTSGSFDKWAEEVGDSSYKWEHVLPFYKKSTQFTTPKNPERASNATITTTNEILYFDKKGGPLQVSYPNFASAWSSYFPSACNEMGLRVLSDGVNSGVLDGYAYVTLTEDPLHQTRSDSENSFLRVALKSTSLTVYTRALAKRIIFDESKTARSVTIDVAGMNFRLTAKREIIVSAGAFGSPQLLMVSGVGPASVLQKYKIPVIANRPGVGQNMWDNPTVSLSWNVNVETLTTLINQPNRLLEEREKFIHNKTGMLTTSGAESIAYLKLTDEAGTSLSDETRNALRHAFPSDWPEIEVVPFATGPPGMAHDTASIVASLLTTFSRGSVSINSSDMADAPLIDTKWLDDPRDQEQAIAAFKYTRRVAATKSFQKVVLGDELFPGLGVQTNEQILAYLKQTASTLFHASGTCKMGLEKDIDAVVDSDAKVIGVKKLRVVDASAFALLPPGQPQATVYMLAEKIADRILETAWAHDVPVFKGVTMPQQSSWWSLLQTQLGWESNVFTI